MLYLRANSARKDAQGKRRNEAEMNKIFWAADSTVQTNDFTKYPQTGIGQVFPLFVKNEYQIVNHAKNGRSTKSFMDEGRLKAIEEQIGAGDFLFIQFGHNDEKKEDPTRFTEPFSTYMENLETFIRVARDHSAYPVLIADASWMKNIWESVRIPTMWQL